MSSSILANLFKIQVCGARYLDAGALPIEGTSKRDGDDGLITSRERPINVQRSSVRSALSLCARTSLNHIVFLRSGTEEVEQGR